MLDMEFFAIEGQPVELVRLNQGRLLRQKISLAKLVKQTPNDASMGHNENMVTLQALGYFRKRLSTALQHFQAAFSTSWAKVPSHFHLLFQDFGLEVTELHARPPTPVLFAQTTFL